MSRRSDLRALVFEIAGRQCEHPKRWQAMTGSRGILGRCPNRATELAHIVPRGMGHSGYRDTLINVMAACTTHARSTDNLNDPEWDHVPGWADGESRVTKRQALGYYVNRRRRREGADLERSDQ